MPQEMVDEQGDVLAPLAQGGDPHPHHVETVEEVLAEAAGGDLVVDVAGGGRQDPDVHLAGLRLADGADLLVLEDAQQLHLKDVRELADLVEEEGAAVRLHEEPAAGAIGAGEGSLGVTEQLALQERLGDRAAVHRDERLVSAPGLGVDRPGENLLARPALPGEQHRRLELGGALQELEDLDHDGRGRHDGPLSDRAVDVPLEKRIGAAQPLPLLGLANGQEQLGGLEGLRQIVVGAALHRLDGEIGGPVGRHHDHGRPGEPPPDLGQELHSIHTGHSQVTEHHVHRAGLDLLAERPRHPRRAATS